MGLLNLLTLPRHAKLRIPRPAGEFSRARSLRRVLREPLSDPRPRAVDLVERDGKVLVIRRHLDGRDYAVLPGGGIEDGEAPADAALRELREECTLDGRVAELLLEGDHGGRTAFYPWLGDRPIGFALVRGLTTVCRQMGEFFVARAARGTGHARTFAEAVVRAHSGRWEITFQEDNTRAARFWRRLGAEALTGTSEELRPVPDKPYIPADVWLTGTVRP